MYAIEEYADIKKLNRFSSQTTCHFPLSNIDLHQNRHEYQWQGAKLQTFTKYKGNT